MIAYELEPFAIEPPPEAPWRWAIEVDSRAGRARLLEGDSVLAMRLEDMFGG